MRLLFVNEAHPATRHVAGMRLYHFGRAMMARGHDVTQVTGPQPSFVKAGHGPDFPQAAGPWLIPVPPATMTSSAFSPLRRIRTGLRLWHGDRHTREWLAQAKKSTIDALSGQSPDLVWATFGTVESLLLGQELARHFNCPWVVDVKDNWEAYMPFGVRNRVARRLASAGGMTANAWLHQEIAARYFPHGAQQLVYSGVAEPFFKARTADQHSELADATLLLVGSVYQPDVLDDFLATFARWRECLPSEDRARLRLRYVGGSSDAVAAALASTNLGEICEIIPFVPVPELAALVRDSFCSAYLWLPTTFHHKLLELLVAGQAVLAYPGEHRESAELAAQCDTKFVVCDHRDRLGEALTELWAGRAGLAKRDPAPPWHWDDFAFGLEQFFEKIIADRIDH